MSLVIHDTLASVMIYLIKYDRFVTESTFGAPVVVNSTAYNICSTFATLYCKAMGDNSVFSSTQVNAYTIYLQCSVVTAAGTFSSSHHKDL